MAPPQAFPSSVPGETKLQMRTAEDYAQRGSNTALVRSDEFELHQSKRRRLDTHNERSVCITPTEAIKYEQWSTAGCISRETLPNRKEEVYSFECHQNDQASFNWSLEMPLEIQYTASKSAEASPGLHLQQDATQVCSTNEVLFQSFDSSTVSLYYSQHYPPLSDHGHAANLAYLSTRHQSTGVLRELADSPISCSIVNDQVCFGMVTGVPARFSSCHLPQNIFRHPVQLLESGKFSLKGIPFVEGVVGPREAQVLYTLSQDSQLDMQIFLSPSDNCIKEGRNQRAAALTIIVYGPLDLFDDVGDFFQTCNMYLQDPVGCDRNVRYCNPHRLSGLDVEAPMTLDLDSAHRHMHISEISGNIDLLEGLNAPINLPETESPPALVTSLFRHQKQALYFMVKRERGWALDECGKDVWSEVMTPNGKLYMNNITRKTQISRPPQFCGGILADPMGLGKSLSMISLIANDSSNTSQDMSEELKDMNCYESYHFTSATLLIVPPPLIPTWENQFKKHLKEGTLVIRRHHAGKRITKKSQLDNCNVVITTYQTTESEWRKGSGSLLFSLHWRRIILDEAHYVRDRSTNTAKAVCSLHSASRWAVTGTPLQNRLTDLATIFHFLRVCPYDDPKTFDADITQVWKSRQDTHAIERLKRLLQCILLRRSKNSIELPSRVDKLFALDFSHEERSLYEELRTRAVRVLDNALGMQSGSSFRVSYMNSLQRISDLRLICNLGVYKRSTSTRQISLDVNRTKCEWNTAAAQRMFDSLVTVENVSCFSCSLDLDATEDDMLAGGPRDHSHLHISRCLRIICSSCTQQFSESPNANISLCGHVPQCPVIPVSRGSFSNNSSNVSSPRPSEFAQDQEGLSTKVKALITDLQNLQEGVKSVVFSYWRSTLDLIEQGLDQASISYVRFDGKVSPENRLIALDKFRREPMISVILMTISCASVGLDITAASCAYIMEPQWNPTVEEQALARIHRMGQTKEVTTVRFVMKGSFEEHVLKVQRRKRELEDLLLSQKPHTDAENGVNRLEYLHSLLR
ncbi:uncharacterized protein K441DRAFT_651441 [Cenococcum geophilum 1.58]|uniref:uncharacterized protein n=1 Tax=Cenococcum geophilum 1.58 TaxID=794803 RepID=UPI00358F7361|nr:hypothetical protein K441DRAFT_651441 [Cenococcum geophilum 1.58]